jgi:hypothetical protein
VLSLLLNFSGPQAACTNLTPLASSSDDGTYFLQIGIKAPFRQIVGVTYIVTETWSFAAYRTDFCHDYLQKKGA